MNRVAGVIVVHDPACGDCEQIAARLRAVLRPPVTVRSCRDPAVVARHAALRRLGCRVPALGILRADGAVRWWIGWGAAFGAIGTVRLTALPGAIAVLLSTVLIGWRARTGGRRGLSG